MNYESTVPKRANLARKDSNEEQWPPDSVTVELSELIEKWGHSGFLLAAARAAERLAYTPDPYSRWAGSAGYHLRLRDELIEVEKRDTCAI